MTAHEDACGAPICFESPSITAAGYIWYPEEPICGYRTQDAVSRHVRSVQRRIRKYWRTLQPDADFDDADIGYWTFADLVKARAVRKGIRGRNRDAEA